MRMLKRILLALVVLVVAAVAVAYVLPRNVHVERSVVINAPKERVFAVVNDLRRHKEFSPWEGIDPNIRMTFSGAETGAGQKSSWESDNPNVGKGSQEIVESVVNEKVETAIDFGDMGTAQAAFLLSDAEGGTKVVWEFDSDMGMNPIGRYMGLMMDGWIGGDYEKGLSALKAVAESGS